MDSKQQAALAAILGLGGGGAANKRSLKRKSTEEGKTYEWYTFLGGSNKTALPLQDRVKIINCCDTSAGGLILNKYDTFWIDAALYFMTGQSPTLRLRSASTDPENLREMLKAEYDQRKTKTLANILQQYGQSMVRSGVEQPIYKEAVAHGMQTSERSRPAHGGGGNASGGGSGGGGGENASGGGSGGENASGGGCSGGLPSASSGATIEDLEAQVKRAELMAKLDKAKQESALAQASVAKAKYQEQENLRKAAEEQLKCQSLMSASSGGSHVSPFATPTKKHPEAALSVEGDVSDSEKALAEMEEASREGE